jgi:hypothetical protein
MKHAKYKLLDIIVRLLAIVGHGIVAEYFISLGNNSP